MLSTSFVTDEALTWPLGLKDARLHVRRWLLHGGEIGRRGPDGLPAWATAMQAGHPDAVEELMEAGADLNDRDPFGNGWLHWGLGSGQSPRLLIRGLQQLDQTWWHPNRSDDTPFHHLPIPQELAQVMGARLWGERVSWERVSHGRDPEALARGMGANDLADIWARWKGIGVP